MEAWQATVQDESGNVVFNPQITVYESDGVTLASIYNEDGSPKDNPFTGSLEGFAQFWAGPGVYKISGANGGQTELWERDLGIAKAARLAAGMTPMDFGAVGDGVADDTAAVIAAASQQGVVKWGRETYRVTDPVAVDQGNNIHWEGDGARLIYDGPLTTEPAFIFRLPAGGDNFVSGLEFDAQHQSPIAVDFRSMADQSTPEDDRGSIFLDRIIGRNATLRDDLPILGSGICVSGGWGIVDFDNCQAYDIYMTSEVAYSTDRAVGGIRTVFGDTFVYPAKISVTDCRVENVWGEGKSGPQQEADGLSLFQHVGVDEPSNNTCFITNYTYRNVGNRAIKLHSAARTIIQGVHGTQDAAVLPFSGAMRAAHIDCQQGGALISNVECVFKGVWPPYLIQNYTEQHDHARQGGQVCGVNVWFSPGTNSETVLIRNRNDNLQAGASSYTDLLVANVNAVGSVKAVAQVGARDGGEGRLALVNISAECDQSLVIVQATGALSDLDISVAQAFQKGAAVPVVTRLDGNPVPPTWRISTLGALGYSDMFALQTARGERMRLVRGSGTGLPPNISATMQIDSDDHAIISMSVPGSSGDSAGFQIGTPGNTFRGGLLYAVGETLEDDYLNFRVGGIGGVVQIDSRGMRLGSRGPRFLRGSGTPEGAVAAPVSSIYLRSDGGAGDTFYVKESGTGNTGWVAK